MHLFSRSTAQPPTRKAGRDSPADRRPGFRFNKQLFALWGFRKTADGPQGFYNDDGNCSSLRTGVAGEWLNYCPSTAGRIPRWYKIRKELRVLSLSSQFLCRLWTLDLSLRRTLSRALSMSTLHHSRKLEEAPWGRARKSHSSATFALSHWSTLPLRSTSFLPLMWAIFNSPLSWWQLAACAIVKN